MNFDLIEDYNKPEVKEVNKFVSIAIYNNDERNNTIVCIKNEKEGKVQTIYLFEETLKKILEKIS